MPFEVPHGWKWVELGKLAIDSADGPFGSNLKKDHYTTNKEVRIIQLSNIGEDGWKDENTKYTTFEHLAAISRSEVKSGDIVIAKMMPAGRAILCPDSDLKYVLSSDAVKFVLPEGICNKYVLNAINSAVFREQVYDNVQGVTRVRTSLQKLRTYLLPIPPLAEQYRIVTSIEQWISFIDSIESSTTDLLQSVQSAKSKILDLAIHGKLVPQDDHDEPASELLKRINPKAVSSCDNPQYGKVPSGWVWCKIEDIFKVVMGQSPNGDSVNHKFIGVEFHQGKLFFSQCIVEKSDVYTTSPTKLADKDSLLVCVRAPVGDVNITDREICIGRGLCALKPLSNLPLDYWFYAIKSLKAEFNKKATGSTFLAISAITIKNQVISLPPYKEQLRIVSKINELFSQLDMIEKSLQA